MTFVGVFFQYDKLFIVFADTASSPEDPVPSPEHSTDANGKNNTTKILLIMWVGWSDFCYPRCQARGSIQDKLVIFFFDTSGGL